MTQPLIEFCQVTKCYGSLRANDQLTFGVQSGSIHAIIGENGAGKTTAMKLLFGMEMPTSGHIQFDGKPKCWTNPRGAMAAGIGMVHQHFMLSPVHTALDNVILGREISSGFIWSRWMGFIHRNKLRADLEAISTQVGFQIPWDQAVEHLPVGIQQQLEIVKLLHAGVRVMIFDEPTAVLSPEEINKFLKMLKSLNAQGKTIIVITHKLKEVKEIADTVTVLRRGECVATKANGDVSIQDMADLMVGRHVHLGRLNRLQRSAGQPLLQISNLSTRHQNKRRNLSNISLDVREGQIVGIAGVEGSGQGDVFLAGWNSKFVKNAALAFEGDVQLFGESSIELNESKFRTMPVAIVPADRLREAVLPNETLLENDMLGHDAEFRRFPWIAKQYLDRGLVRKRLIQELKTFDVRPQDPDAILGGLSGGNQQKFVMARELSRDPKLILCAQPTRGVDVGSIEQIHGELLKRRDLGAGVLLISSQLEELMALSDVIHVMFEGAIVATFQGPEFDEGQIGIAMGGGKL